MRIIANEVGVFKGRFMGFKPCKNAEYVMVKLQFLDVEIDGEISNTVQPQTSMILHESVDMGIFQGLNEGQLCHFKISVGYQSPNNRDGKTYPGGVKFKVLQAAGIKE